MHATARAEWTTDGPQCPRFRAGEVTDYLEGALTDEDAEEVELHLIACAECADVLHAHRQVAWMLRRLGLGRPIGTG